MRRRAFIPEAPDGLEGRALLSGAGHDPHPGAAPLSGRAFGVLTLQTRGFFEQFAISGDAALLKSQLQEGNNTLPYHAVDQLSLKSNRIVDQMVANLAAGVPGAIKMGYEQTVTGLKADFAKRIENGTVHVYEK
jgi:hypothetical protein